VNILKKIIDDKKKSLDLIKKNKTLNFLDNKIKNLDCFYDFKDTLKKNEKISRNEKCPATGKKFKYCCGAL